ncbi:MAG: family 78 glycoside hydrolase catalytic domain [Lachnospiraceae bacterium]|nr:family 78 glycoside hydrolase catalytic domain [Lachnospiraceae bacterium]
MPAAWQAKWIDPELPHDKEARQPASYLRRTFTLEKTGEALLYITCHGLYEAWVNGQRAGDFVLAPGTGDYAKRLTVQCYDVSPLLQVGENEISVILGDGWYRGCVGIDGLRNYYGEDLALLCQLEIDGKPVLVSDEHWEASQEGPVRENDLQQGECYDARREEIRGWHSVTVRDYGFAALAPTMSVPILEQERFPGKVFTTPNGETVIDFGQNLAGYTQLEITAKAGDKITLRHGETLDENGNFTQKNFDPGDRNKNGIPQKIEYICKDGRNVYRPRFAIFGFRFAKVETDVDLTSAVFTAVAVYSEMPQTGFFECGNEDVNRLFLNSLWSMRSNFCDVPTDCPTRERAGWTGDAGIFAPTAVYLADCYPVLRKWLGECRLAQGEDGLVQNIAPVNNSGSMISNMLQGSAGWGDACVLVPWALYEAYGDRTILEENYDMMVRWLAFSKMRARKTRPHNLLNPYHRYLVDEGFHFGEWCQPDVDNGAAMKKAMMTGAPEPATAYFYRSASLLARIAGILGRREDEQYYTEISENAKKAYRHTCTKNGAIRSDRQCEYVRPIAFGLLDGDEIQAAADALNELVVKNGYHLNTGFLSTPDLTRVLAENGHADTAYRLLLQTEAPSWLYAVRKGATTIWETWDGIRADGTVHDSLNHYSYGAVTGWLFSGVCGIRLKAGDLTIRPYPDRCLGYAKAEWRSPAGTIRSAWEYREDMLLLDFSVPIPAEIILPNGEEHHVEEGEHHYELHL